MAPVVKRKFKCIDFCTYPYLLKTQGQSWALAKWEPVKSLDHKTDMNLRGRNR